MPGIVATAIYTFINAWNEFLYSLILINSTDKMTVSVALKSLQGAEILNWGRYDGGISSRCCTIRNLLYVYSK